jgi:hypothetical protein
MDQKDQQTEKTKRREKESYHIMDVPHLDLTPHLTPKRAKRRDKEYYNFMDIPLCILILI